MSSGRRGTYAISVNAFANAAHVHPVVLDKAIAEAGIAPLSVSTAGKKLYSLEDILQRVVFNRDQLPVKH